LTFLFVTTDREMLLKLLFALSMWDTWRPGAVGNAVDGGAQLNNGLTCGH
jgi:hypothetical protein